MVWYSGLIGNISQFVVINTVKGFSIVSEAEIDIFLEFSCFYYDPTDVAWRIPGTVEPGRLPSMGSKRVGHN